MHWAPSLSLGLCGYFWIGSLLLTLYALGPCRWACVDIIWIGSLLLTIYALGPWCWAYVDTLEWVPAVDPMCWAPAPGPERILWIWDPALCFGRLLLGLYGHY